MLSPKCVLAYFLKRSTSASSAPLTTICSIDERWERAASATALPMTPGPIRPRVLESRLARCFTATPGTAPVRYAESRFADITANGAPVSVSLRMYKRIDRGSPSDLFSRLDPYHLVPVAWNLPPKYAGIAMNLRSGPSWGMLSNSGDFGKLIIAP